MAGGSRTRKRSKTTQGESSTPSLDVVKFVSAEQRSKYAELFERRHTIHCWYDDTTSMRFKMHDAMVEAFDRLGGASLLTMNLPAYKALTCEMLSSLSTDITTLTDHGTISFRLGNETREMTLQEWNESLGFTIVSQRSRLVGRFPIKTTFWRRISGRAAYPTTHPNLTQIASPLFRYILRVLGHTVYARKEKSKPTVRELLMLFHCLHTTRSEKNLGFEFFQHLLAYQKKGDLLVGGMIAHIDEYFDVDFDLYTPSDPLSINSEYLALAKICGFSDTLKRIVAYFEGREIPIDVSMMDVRVWENWFRIWAGRPLPAGFLTGADKEDLKPIAEGDTDEMIDDGGAGNEVGAIGAEMVDSDEPDDDEEDDDGEDNDEEMADAAAPPPYYTQLCQDMTKLSTDLVAHQELWEGRWKSREDYMTRSLAF